MRVLFSNPPWYTLEGGPETTNLRGVRAGSRWPHQFEFRSAGPVHGHINELIGGYIPFPVFLATAAALAKRSAARQTMLRLRDRYELAVLHFVEFLLARTE